MAFPGNKNKFPRTVAQGSTARGTRLDIFIVAVKRGDVVRLVDRRRKFVGPKQDFGSIQAHMQGVHWVDIENDDPNGTALLREFDKLPQGAFPDPGGEEAQRFLLG